jgi:hypothetical protein
MGSNSEIPGSMFLAIGNRMLRIVEIIACGLVVHARSGADAGVVDSHIVSNSRGSTVKRSRGAKRCLMIIRRPSLV